MRTMFLIILFMPWLVSAQNLPYPELRQELDSIRYYDQLHRDGIDAIASMYAADTAGMHKQLQDHWKIMRAQDSVNLVKVESIINRYGWLSAEEIGEAGNSTLFLVIQHSDINSQEKFLPKLRKAVLEGNARAADLALLEDRTAICRGRRQKYGSQVAWDILTDNYYVLPLENPDEVDERRRAVGLSPIAEYLIVFNIKWDVEKYKKDLPAIEAQLWKK